MSKSKKLTNKEIEKFIANVKASFAIENLYITDEEENVGRKFLKGELTENEALETLGVKSIK